MTVHARNAAASASAAIEERERLRAQSDQALAAERARLLSQLERDHDQEAIVSAVRWGL